MLNVLRNVLVRLRSECLASGYEVLLEADVSGWLFHLLLTQPEIQAEQIHFDTRVCGADARKRFDVVIGGVQAQLHGRPCIEPQLVVEVKVFPRIGFTHQQHRVHYEHVLGSDLRKLGGLAAVAGLCASLIVDGAGYLEGTYQGHNRRAHMIETRDRVAPEAHVFMARLAGGTWQLEHSPGRSG